MGRQKAASLLLGCDTMTAAELETTGLITKVLPRHDFLQSVLEICYRIAKQPPEAPQCNKYLLMRTSRQELLDVDEAELKTLRTRARSAEALWAVDAFLSDQECKKKPKSQSKP